MDADELRKDHVRRRWRGRARWLWLIRKRGQVMIEHLLEADLSQPVRHDSRRGCSSPRNWRIS